MDIARSALGALAQMGKGGYGIVYAAPDLVLPDAPGPLLVKLFTADTVVRSEVDRLRAIVNWRLGLDFPARALLDELSAWPVRVVVDGRKIVGIVMRRAPERFFFDFVPKARNAKPGREPITIQALIEPAANARSRTIPSPDDDDDLTRIITCARLALFIRLLHSHDMIYGDLSQGNVLTSHDPAPPAILVIDCDAAYPAGSTKPNRQYGTRTWFSPEEETNPKFSLDRSTDVYKLCLAILRILASGAHTFQMTRASNLKGILDDPGVELIARGLGKDRDARPTADEIYRYLRAELDGRSSPPEILRWDMREPYLVIGASFDIVIDVNYASSISVTTPEGRTLTVPLAQAHSALRFSAVQSGSYVLTVSNRFGTVSMESEPVRVVRPPDLLAVHYPEPEMPTITIADMAVLRRGLEAAEGTSALLAAPFDQLERLERQFAVYDGLFAPTQHIRDRLQVPNDLFAQPYPHTRTDDHLNPMDWPMAGPHESRTRRFARLFRPSREAHR